MEGEGDKRICVQTYESCGSFRIYSVISFVDLEDLKTQLTSGGFKSVGLAKSGWYDDYETTVGGSIKIHDLELESIEWCKEKTGEHRYLALYR